MEKLGSPELASRANGRPVKLLFQDEARFGRMVRIRRCWAEHPCRPVVHNAYQREYTYVYGAVNPQEGRLEWMICQKMNTTQMGAFLGQVSQAYEGSFVLMIVDGASSHVSKELVVPENIELLRLPAYSPELNPQEHVWDEVREKYFPNRVYDSMDKVIGQLNDGLPELAASTGRLRSLTFWPWIFEAISIAS